ncbi:MAG: nitronate monooxygenase [Micromonosporaceae bacterium]|nr:nitronate monooxygenase [Micromonosporaceae bacterium]
MSLATPFTDFMAIEHPIALAPMGGSAGGALAAAVSNGGGLGLVGGGRGSRAWMERELAIVTARTGKPWGIGFLTWAIDIDTIVWALDQRPHAVMLSFGDPGPYAARVRATGVPLIIQVTDLDEAQRAVDVGADLIVAQGTEAGGHGGRRATLPFVPTVVDFAEPTPVLAAGGIADGRGLAAALALGAAGALIGTRFLASHEAMVPAEVRKAIIDGHGADTERTRVLDLARGSGWPAKYTARVLRNAFVDRWRGREEELAHDLEAHRPYGQAVDDDLNAISIWCSEAIDLIHEIEPAADLVHRLASDAAAALARAADGTQTTPSR